MWTLDKSGADFGRWYDMTGAARDKWDEFQDAVHRGADPADAAFGHGWDYKCLNPATNQFQIRLSKKHRATFTVDRARQVVTVLQVGGHT